MSAEPTDLILRERARALAQVPHDEAPRDALELVEFRLAAERYAVESRFVAEVQPFRDLTPLPGTPDFVRGIVNLRGRILPVFDLKRFFDLPEAGITDLHRILVIEGHGMSLGLLADVVVGVRHVETAGLTPGLATLTGIGAEYLKGVTGEHLVVLDLDRVLSDPRIVVDDLVE